jgi:hypothetical protein
MIILIKHSLTHQSKRSTILLNMEKVNLPFFYQLGSQLNPLSKMQVTPQNRIEILFATYGVRNNVLTLLNWGGGLKVCHSSANALIKAIDEIQKWASNTKTTEKWTEEDPGVDWQFQQVIEKAKNFEAILSEELPLLSAYWATKKGIYSPSDLIDNAEKVFPPSVLEKLSESAVQEVAQGGRCLAFDISTASGFHMLRATEEVLHDYYIAVCKPKSKGKLENWGAYISALYELTKETSTTKADIKDHIKRVLALLQQIKNQDRNLIMHPEIILNADEAFILFEITKSAIMAMSDKLPKRLPKHKKKSP